MKSSYCDNLNFYDIGVDEAGRGPLLGRVYSAAVILPKDDFHHEWMKDSKLIKSEKKMNELAEYIKENAISWSIHYSTEEEIDEINILQATQKCMKECIQNILDSPKTSTFKINLLIDGNYFKPGNLMVKYKHLKEIACIKGGDHTFTCIAAASILAKHARDVYIKEHNKRFKVKPEDSGSAFLPIAPHINLDLIFSVKSERMVRPDNTVTFENVVFQIEPSSFRISFSKCKVSIHKHIDHIFSIAYGPHILGTYSPDGKLLEPKKVLRNSKRRRVA